MGNDWSGYILVLAMAAIVLVRPAHAQEHDGSYYCVTEFVGGVAYDETLKKWDSAKFRPHEKFVVHFKHAGPHMVGDQSYTDDYLVTITPSGSNKTEVCKGWYPEMHDKIEFTRDVGRGDCQTILRRYIFGLKYNRFLSTFEAGDYVLGIDQRGDTPSISGGTCTKIQ
jgi:hypothetical protein